MDNNKQCADAHQATIDIQSDLIKAKDEDIARLALALRGRQEEIGRLDGEVALQKTIGALSMENEQLRARSAPSAELVELRRLAEAAGGARFATEGFEQIAGNGQFYGGLIMHENGETIIAQCVLQPWADYIAAASPAVILCLIDALAAQPVPQASGERDAYSELIYAVASKFPGETRHQTALRYIREREASAPSSAATTSKPDGSQG